MKYDPGIHHRRSIRLRHYDYEKAGFYFVTMCVEGRECICGEIREGEMILNDAGRMVAEWWSELPKKFENVIIDSHMIMPNHFHGIIALVGADLCVRPGSKNLTDLCVRPDSTGPGGRQFGEKDRGKGAYGKGAHADKGAHAGAPLHVVVQWFKTMTTNAYIRGVKEADWPPFAGRLWQRNYYERVIRDEDELKHVREYILENPRMWEMDKENPANIP